MSFFLIIPSYLFWHYTEALRDMTRVWTNFLWFVSNFFSMSLLAKSLFAPWKRIQETKTSNRFSLEDIAAVILTNTVMRLVGALVRLIVLLVGSLAVLAVFWGGLLFYAVWLLLPVLIPISFLYGLSALVF